MLPWLTLTTRRAVLAALATQLGHDDWCARVAEDDAWASSNAVAQPLMTGLSLAAWPCWPRICHRKRGRGLQRRRARGHCVAGVFDAPTALQLAGSAPRRWTTARWRQARPACCR